ncbi:MAG: thioredoxin-disulfide reductase [Bifidobacterium sp.]|nr:thioredoxin-disulfide reductase [Bifidobacterium sp.]
MSLFDTNTIHDVAIIGSGPAGYTAALYAARANLKPIVFEGIEYGGLLMQTTEVENFPGFSNGIMGPELMEEIRSQAEKFGATLISSDVEEVDLSGDVKTLTVEGEVCKARTVILSTGAVPRYLGVPGEQEFLGRGVSACATCDGFFFRDKPIVVVGGGDSAMEEATFLTKFGSSVTIIHRRNEFRASKVMIERATSNPKIKTIMDAQVVEVLGGDDGVTGLRVRHNDGREEIVETAALFVAIGHEPRTELFRSSIDLDEAGYVKVAHPSTATSLPGVFAAGDVADPHYQQAITAAGSGCRAALDVEQYLAGLEG